MLKRKETSMFRIQKSRFTFMKIENEQKNKHKAVSKNIKKIEF